MKEAIRQRALELGFDGCRFTTAAPPGSAPHFREWLAQGRHGEMQYLARNAPKRVAPQEVLPGARSIVTLAASYAGGDQTPTTQTVSFEGERSQPGAGMSVHAPGSRSSFPLLRHTGEVARYARFADYHGVLRAPLAELAAFIDRLGGLGTRSLWYVDTGPILERDIAERAGLGFVGKHTSLISRKLGNWFFLAEILTTAALEPDSPERNHCGSCSRCLGACPTHAITAPFQLDARLCISYLTIELKGPIPPELRPAIGTRIYGCDDCLAACPWNRFAREGRLMKPHAKPDLAAPDLLELLSLDDNAFQQRFAGTPMLRAKRCGLLRNVCVALGNLRDPSALSALERAARDPEPLIAEHAAWAVGQILSGMATGDT